MSGSTPDAQMTRSSVHRAAQVHPYDDHPAALVLADHEVSRWSRYGTIAHCACGAIAPCTAAGNRYAAHLAEVLHQAGLLVAVCPHGTPLTAPHCQGCDDVRDSVAPPEAGPLKEEDE